MELVERQSGFGGRGKPGSGKGGGPGTEPRRGEGAVCALDDPNCRWRSRRFGRRLEERSLAFRSTWQAKTPGDLCEKGWTFWHGGHSGHNAGDHRIGPFSKWTRSNGNWASGSPHEHHSDDSRGGSPHEGKRWAASSI